MFKNRTCTLWRTVRITDHEAHRRHGATLLPFRRLPHAPARRLEIPETPLTQQHTCAHLPLRRTQARAADPTAGMARWRPPPPPPRAETAAAFRFQVEAGAPVSAATPRPSVVCCPRRWTPRGGGGETAPSVPSSFPSPTLAAGPELYIGGAIPLRLLTDSIRFGFDWAFVS